MSISTQNSTTSVTTETIVEARDAAFAALAGGFDLVDLSETLGRTPSSGPAPRRCR